MSEVVVFDLFGLLQGVEKYPCDIIQQCSLVTEAVFVLHPFLFLALVWFALIGFFYVFWVLQKYNFGIDWHD